MTKIIIFLLTFFISSITSQSIILQAENGIITGGSIIRSSASDYTGTGYVGHFPNSDDTLTLSYTSTTVGLHILSLRYMTSGSGKQCTINVNQPIKSNSFTVYLENSQVFVMGGETLLDMELGLITIEIVGNWGWFDIDAVHIDKSEEKDYSIVDRTLISNVNQETQELYDYLRSIYGKKTLAGHTHPESEDVNTLLGKYPVQVAWDIASYTEGWPYLWDNGQHAFGWVDNGMTSSIIDFYSQTNGLAIISIQFHWHSPCELGECIPGRNNFYVDYTDFDVREAVKPGTTQYNLIIRDLDSIAVELKKLEVARIPILWRPLHEADGGWFWWGAHGKEPCLALYDIMLERLNNYHGLRNLIWVWSRANSESWYPGNDKVDIYGMDSYPAAFSYETKSSDFHSMYETCEGKKMIAMTECGPIPDIVECYNADSKWLYFSTWADFYLSHNSAQHFEDTYNLDLVITLDERSQSENTCEGLTNEQGACGYLTGNGFCTSSGCSCSTDWQGNDCEVPRCDDVICNLHQSCTAPDTCSCLTGWGGNDCDTPECDPPCGVNFECSAPDLCRCADGWTGINCDQPEGVCNPPCNENQECDPQNKCICSNGYEGVNCYTPVCTEPECNPNQNCTSPNTCTCILGWYGPKCDIRDCHGHYAGISCIECLYGWTGNTCDVYLYGGNWDWVLPVSISFTVILLILIVIVVAVVFIFIKKVKKPEPYSRVDMTSDLEPMSKSEVEEGSKMDI